MAESVFGSRTPPHPIRHSGDYARLGSLRHVQCRCYEYGSGEIELWEPSSLQSALPFEVKYQEKCLVAQGVSRGALRVVRQFKPRSQEALVFAKEQVVAITKPKFAYHFLQYLQVFETDDHQEDNGIPDLHLMTEDCPLGNLQLFITTNGSIREEEVRTIMRQLCNGLGLLHQEGLAHGDLQLCNNVFPCLHVFIERLPEQNTVQHHREWRVKIGGCRLHYPTSPISHGSPENFISTVAHANLSFLSPEILGCYTLSKPSTIEGFNGIQAFDIWAAGEVAAQMLTGSPTFGLDLQKIFNYQAGTVSFPTKKLDQAMVSQLGKRFIATFMHQDPFMRPRLPLDPRRDSIVQWIEPANYWQAHQLKSIPLATFHHDKILPPTLYYTPDGSKLVVIDPHTITIRSSSAGFISSWIYENDWLAEYRASALSFCGKRLAVYDAHSKAIKMFDLSKRRNTGPSISYPVSEPLISPPVSNFPLVQLQQPQTILNFHPTGSTLLAASPGTFTTLNVSVLPNPADPLPYQPKTDSREEPILNACYTNDGLATVVSHRNHTIFTLLSNGKVTRTVAHPVPARVVAIAPDGHRLILGSKDGDIWSLSTSSFVQSDEGCWVSVWRGVDGYPVDSIDIALSSTPLTQEAVTSADAVTVAVVSGERLTLLSIGEGQDDYCLGWVEFKMRKALIAKIKPRADRENHLEIALWSGGQSKITFLKFEGFCADENVQGGNIFKGPAESAVAGEIENHNERAKEQRKEQDHVYTSTTGILICERGAEIDGAGEGRDDGEEDDDGKYDKKGEGASSSGCGSWVVDDYTEE